MAHVTVVGGGLAGCEAAWQLASRGHEVTLVEMRPARRTPAHQTDRLAELVCTNSFKSEERTNAHGLLKAEMRALGWVGAGLPRMIAVQAAGCAPIVRAWEDGRDHAVPVSTPRTIAAGLRVPAAIGDYLMLRAVRESDGAAVAVGDDEILAAIRDLAATEGVLAAPEAAATVAALVPLRARGVLGPADEVVLLLTGSGLKYTDLLDHTLPGLEALQETPPARHGDGTPGATGRPGA